MSSTTPEPEHDPSPRFMFEPVTEAIAREVLTWRYDPPYDFYDPPMELSAADLAAMLSPESPHFGVRDVTGALIGFLGIGPEAQVPGGDYSSPAIDIGIGMRPDQTGRGLGRIVLASFLEHLRELGYPPSPLRATIAAFNIRSQRTFHHLGFRETAGFRTGMEQAPIEWVVLVRPLAPGSDPA